MEEIEKLLYDFVELYNTLNGSTDSTMRGEKMEQFVISYYDLLEKEIDYISILDRELADDMQLYVLVLSALFYISKDFLLLDKVRQLLLTDSLSVDVSLRISSQVVGQWYSNGGSAKEYLKERALHRRLYDRLQKELNHSWQYIPYEERNHHLIVLETDTLLSTYHAPTKMVLEICKTLRAGMGYEVFLMVNYLKMDSENMRDYWVLPAASAYNPQLNGYFCLQYEGEEFCGYQQVIAKNNFTFVNHLMKIIREKKPEFVWHIGGESVISDLFAKVTTLVSMPCSDGYAVSEAPILVSYLQIDKETIRSMEEYNRSHSQRMIQMVSMIDMGAVVEEIQDGKVYPPEEFGIPANSFVISIVGNRLDREVTEDFIAVMEEIAAREPEVYFLVIGKKDLPLSNEGALRDRVVYLGYRRDLAVVLKSTQLFLNPPRQGGGGGAAYSVLVGVPVVTLPNCDAANVGEEFVCHSLEEFPETVSRYCHDQEFYQEQAAVCQRVYQESRELDLCGELKKTVSQIRELIMDEEQ